MYLELNMSCIMEYYITGAESTPKQDFLTQKLNFPNTVSVQRQSYQPIPIRYTIRTEIFENWFMGDNLAHVKGFWRQPLDFLRRRYYAQN